MTLTYPMSNHACGSFAIVAILFASGCATPTLKRPLAQHHLETFQIDCARKTEQIAFLESQRTTGDDRLWAWATNYVTPWTAYTDTEQHNERRSVSSGRVNWLISQKMMRLAKDCP